ncbi:exodeoxyribonuclease III [Aestuariivirga litoralis]|uniref:exodeoxyribonuclease III n=1 Tax=Aestuariivirga litoralis TaxID=2650924 RepID=UPI0018C473E6|nr:exodeoxyribonuclease III [Aestuariivirga litoralis]MBG1231624.1 exodeoxyribonuclease III [Aestuariivirga litoralis]
MRIATWNVNSVKAHFDQVTSWVKAEKPDVLCLQEIKCEEPNFPKAAFEELGYSCEVLGQKTYNGVALLARGQIHDVVRGLPGDDTDEQSRFIMGTVYTEKKIPVTVGGLYLPNGNPAPGPKYDYKLSWMKRLKALAQSMLAREEAFVLAGDYNIIPAVADMRKPEQWVNDALWLPDSRAAFQELINLGLTEAFRSLYPGLKDAYSYWDYQAGAWQRNNGIRIDHLLLSPQAADLLEASRIHKEARGHEKPSDHVPVEITLRDI